MSETDADNFASQLLALASLPGVGIATLRRLVAQNDGLAALWQADRLSLIELLHRAKVRNAAVVSQRMIEQHDHLLAAAAVRVASLRKAGIQVIQRRSSQFSTVLAQCTDSPAWLFVEGDASILQWPMLGVVGTRKASTAGLQITRELVRIAGEAGLGVVSGLAEGVDEVAHRAALEFALPQVAVLAGGLNRLSMPVSTRPLRIDIAARRGVIVSEYLPGTQYLKAHFVERDRIQSGLGLALCVVEGKRSGGVAVAIRFAKAQGRPIFGIYWQHIQPDNELVADLLAAGYPTYDMHNQQQVQALRDMLSALPHSSLPSLSSIPTAIK